MIEIINKNDCTGCYACLSVCPTQSISMAADDEGFWYPKIDLFTCKDCDLCVKTCPIIHGVKVQNQPSAYAAFQKNDGIRMQSSSGGVFTSIAEYIIQKDGVVFGACFDDDFNVIHDYVETTSDIKKFRGSKYVQSKIGDVFKQVETFLEQKRLVFFTGTPCQIAGLKSYLRKESDYLVTQDIICHGVPSPIVWKKYLEKFSGNGEVQSISFRNKDMGWAKFSMKVVTTAEQYRRDLSKDCFLKAFLHDLCLRPSCYHCHFKTLHRESDITLADFWGIEVLLPEMNDDKGISLVLTNSAKGERLFQEINDELISQPVDILDATKFNKAATQSVPLPEKRRYFFDNLDEVDFDRLVEQCTKEKHINKIKRIVRKNGSKAKRLILCFAAKK